MLLITRRTGEGIVINGTIEVKVLDVRGGRVKLGFEYPVGNTIYRQEVFTKIQDENRAAAGMTGAAGAETLVTGKIGTVLASVGRGTTRNANQSGQTAAAKEDADRHEPAREPDHR